MICKNVIFFGKDTINAVFKKNEPNAIYFREIEKGLYSVVETTSKCDGEIKYVIIFEDIKAPLEVIRSLELAQTLHNNRIDLGKMIFDFTNDTTGYSWDIVKSWFKNVARRMAYSIGMDKNDFSRLYFDVVGA